MTYLTIYTGIQISQYADDIALWKSNRNVQFLEKKDPKCSKQRRKLVKNGDLNFLPCKLAQFFLLVKRIQILRFILIKQK